mgnify:CR=1 FL=1
MAEVLNSLLEMLARYGFSVLGAVVILLVGYLVAKWIRMLLRSRLTKREVDGALVAFIANLAYCGVLTFTIVAALRNFGVQTASLIAVIGAIGLAVGLALQGSLSNFAAGIVLIVLRPFRAGDWVEVGGTMGTVEEIGMFTTTLCSPDNKTVVVPNAQVTSDSIINYTDRDTRRVDLVFGIGYGDDIRKAKEVIMDVLTSDERVLEDPAPVVAVSELGDSSVNLIARPWVKTADYWDVYRHFLEQVKLRFDEEGITIPFPQQDVHMIQEEAG